MEAEVELKATTESATLHLLHLLYQPDQGLSSIRYVSKPPFPRASAVAPLIIRPPTTMTRRFRSELLEVDYKLSEKGRVLTLQTKSAISAVKQRAEHMLSTIMSNDYFSAGALWLSGTVKGAC
ncbi:hypothetical protein NE237_009005 [Protea cynaroides]|uniref:Uncharacterized protein n=1 Tax=Protea cynaroides TaxID=273540 RepID=A0A9Q0R0A8_9MAGN|nr:hypothetical protein NE237_009005 [Protea cynaroides]